MWLSLVFGCFSRTMMETTQKTVSHSLKEKNTTIRIFLLQHGGRGVTMMVSFGSQRDGNGLPTNLYGMLTGSGF